MNEYYQAIKQFINDGEMSTTELAEKLNISFEDMRVILPPRRQRYLEQDLINKILLHKAQQKDNAFIYLKDKIAERETYAKRKPSKY